MFKEIQNMPFRHVMKRHPAALIGTEVRQRPFKYMMVRVCDESPAMWTGVSHGHHMNFSASEKNKKTKTQTNRILLNLKTVLTEVQSR